MKNELNEEKIYNKISKHIKVLIGSNNKAKIEGAKLAFEKYFSDFEIISEDISSGVNAQPINDEILLGARNRIKGLRQLNLKDIDFYISNEAGLINIGDLFVNINLGLIEDINGYESIGTSQGYMIPKTKVELVKNKSLGIVMDEIFNGVNLFLLFLFIIF